MLNIVEVLGVGWTVGGLIHDYLTGSVWWVWMIEAGLFVAGIVTGGVAELMRQAARMGLRRAIAGLSKRAAIAL
jgi:hypothetical protein